MIEIMISPVIAALLFTLVKKEKPAVYVAGSLVLLQAVLFFPLGTFVFSAVCLTVMEAGGTKKKTEGRKELFEIDENTALAFHAGLLAYCVVFLYNICETFEITAVFYLASVLANGFLVNRWKAPARRCVLCVLFLAALTVRKLL